MQNFAMGMPFNGGPFGDLHPPQPPHYMDHQHIHQQSQMAYPPPPPHHHMQDPFTAMMPMGSFMSPMSMMMMNPFGGFQQAMSMANNGTNNGGFSYCSSSVTSYTTDDQGRPQVYQQSQEVKQGPSGVKETKSAIRDSRTGHQELSIGHHIQDKAHIKKKTKNVYSGEEEQLEDFVNLDETEAESFERNWTQHARNLSQNCYPNQIQYASSGGSRPSANRLALTDGSEHVKSYIPATGHISDKSAMKTKKKKNKKRE